MDYVIPLRDIRNTDVHIVGGKAASLGEMLAAGLPVPDGFSTTAGMYFDFIGHVWDDGFVIEDEVERILAGLNIHDTLQVQLQSDVIRQLIMSRGIPADMAEEIITAYELLGSGEALVAVRSSATAEDLPEASFAGQQDSYLNVRRAQYVVRDVQACWASLWNAEAMVYRALNGFDHFEVGIGVVVQAMVQARTAGVMFTAHSLNGDPKVIEINAGWGLGEAVVGNHITPDLYRLTKKDLDVFEQVISPQERMLTLNTASTGERDENNIWVQVPETLVHEPKLTTAQLHVLAEHGLRAERHYGGPQDMEWAIDTDGNVFVLQSRPVTVVNDDYEDDEPVTTEEPAPCLFTGFAASPGVVTGRVVFLEDASQCHLMREGDLLFAEFTIPAMMPGIRVAGGVAARQGGTNSHASIVTRELGKPSVIGIAGFLEKLVELGLLTLNADGTIQCVNRDVEVVVTIDGSHGEVFLGEASTRLAWNERRLARKVIKKAKMAAVKTRTKIMAILADPGLATEVAAENVDGIGLLRAEEIYAGIGTHPRRFIADGRETEFVRQLADGIRRFVEAFGPDREVTYRLLDFKPNELAGLVGGEEYEEVGENPMMGLRGAAYYLANPEIMALEIAAILEVYQEFPNLKVMVPFVRTPREFKRVLRAIRKAERQAGLSGLIVGMMAELPVNVLRIEDFLAAGPQFISIGSNDLTQFIMALDRDDERVADIADEMHPAVLQAIEHIITACHAAGIPVGICGQGPSKHKKLVELLVRLGITSISVTQDVLPDTRGLVASVEREMLDAAA